MTYIIVIETNFKTGNSLRFPNKTDSDFSRSFPIKEILCLEHFKGIFYHNFRSSLRGRNKELRKLRRFLFIVRKKTHSRVQLIVLTVVVILFDDDNKENFYNFCWHFILKVNAHNNRKRGKICFKLTIKTLEEDSIVDFEHVLLAGTIQKFCFSFQKNIVVPWSKRKLKIHIFYCQWNIRISVTSAMFHDGSFH